MMAFDATISHGEAGRICAPLLICMENRTKYNVGRSKDDVAKRTHNGITFDSILEMKYYRDVLCPLVESGDVVEYELQKPYELQPKFTHDGKTVQPITYVADFYMVFKDGSVKVVDTKGCPDSAALMKRKMFWYKYPDIDYKWMSYVKRYGGWNTYEYIKKQRAASRQAKKNGRVTGELVTNE